MSQETNFNFNLDEVSVGTPTTTTRASRTEGQSVLEVLTSEGSFRLSAMAAGRLGVRAGDHVDFVPLNDASGKTVAYALTKGTQKTKTVKDKEGKATEVTKQTGALLAESGADCQFSSRGNWYKLAGVAMGQKPTNVKQYEVLESVTKNGIAISILKPAGSREKVVKTKAAASETEFSV